MLKYFIIGGARIIEQGFRFYL